MHSSGMSKSVTSKYFRPTTRLQHKTTTAQQHDAAAMKSTSKKKHIKIENENSNAKKPKIIPKWEPPNWKLQLENIRTMRKDKNAPVDTMGCERCTHDEYTQKEKRYHILTSLMLSSQTKDHVTHAAMERLLEHGLTVPNIIEISEEKLGKLIYPVGFWKSKVKYIKKAALMLKEDYDCDIPPNVDLLVKLPGVGPKMAYLTMSCAWDKVVGIGVDVHVHRISNRLGWVQKKTKDPEKTRKELEDWLPSEYWKEANWMLVGFGQQICLPVKPKCESCLNQSICPASNFKIKKG